jgi:Spy/CpxP family protein refolding chaperone
MLLRQARTEIEAASDHADSPVREQLRSIDEGLLELTEGDKTDSDAPPKTAEIRELESKLAGLEDQTNEQTRQHIETAREYLLTYRNE